MGSLFRSYDNYCFFFLLDIQFFYKVYYFGAGFPIDYMVGYNMHSVVGL